MCEACSRGGKKILKNKITPSTSPGHVTPSPPAPSLKKSVLPTVRSENVPLLPTVSREKFPSGAIFEIFSVANCE